MSLHITHNTGCELFRPEVGLREGASALSPTAPSLSLLSDSQSCPLTVLSVGAGSGGDSVLASAMQLQLMAWRGAGLLPRGRRPQVAVMGDANLERPERVRDCEEKKEAAMEVSACIQPHAWPTMQGRNSESCMVGRNHATAMCVQRTCCTQARARVCIHITYVRLSMCMCYQGLICYQGL